MAGDETSHLQPAGVQAVPQSRLEAAGRLAARAHLGDPCFSYLFPDPVTRARTLESLMCWLVRRGHVYGEVTGTAGSLDGVAVVIPSANIANLSEEEQDAETDYQRAEREIEPDALRRLFTEFWGRIFRSASAALHDHLDDGYWEVDLLAVDPARQGQGVGSTLVRDVNRRADQAGAQVGLITVNPRNPPFYERHGYSVVAEATDEPSGVRWWNMRRLPLTR